MKSFVSRACFWRTRCTHADKFWNRVIYPIMDANSRVIGFRRPCDGGWKAEIPELAGDKDLRQKPQPHGLNRALRGGKSDHLRGLYGCHLHAPGGLQQRGGISWNGAHLAAGGAHGLKRYTDEVLANLRQLMR